MNPKQVFASFMARDATHHDIHAHLLRLAQWGQDYAEQSETPALRAEAQVIERFFTATAHDHHQDEEKNVFPLLLNSEQPEEVVQALKTLQQDHHWIELNWREIAPMIRAIADGEDWVEPSELQHGIEVFVNLCLDHITLEETLIYPEAKHQLTAQLAARTSQQAPMV
jgi:hemerythrin-like domain-containing protein